MQVLVVNIRVKEEFVEAFKTATIDNARNSNNEPGIARFDFFQQQDDPTRFTLVEVYYAEEGIAAHKETEHYARWREAVTDMMAEPRVGIRYDNIYPQDDGWS